MNNYTKTLPITGGLTILGIGIWPAIGIVAAIAIITTLAVRYLWRRHKNIGQ